MTSASDLEAQINREDIQPYLNKVYDGDVPVSLIEQFRIAIMLVPITAHKYSMKDVETMSQRHPNEVTNRELGMILNVIFCIPWANMYGSLEEGIEKTRAFEVIFKKYNESTAAFQRKCDAKMQRLLKLGGVTGAANMNGGQGLQIIPK